MSDLEDPDDVPGAKREHPDTFTATPAPLDRPSGAPLLGEPLPLAIRSRANYLLRGEFARGGVGRILRAFNRELGREVAIKELLDASPSAAARFLREARITARLTHPAIVPIYNAGRWPNGRLFYEMKLVNGSSLKELIRASQNLDDRLALLTHVIAVTEAIAYAHTKGVIHRDLKPSNVIVGEFGETVVIDWGLAKQSGDDDISVPSPRYQPSPDLTSSGTLLGTPAYMAPEQARREEVDQRSDVYALGAMLYHTLSGQPPHGNAASVDEVVRRLAANSVPSVLQQEPDLRPELAAIVTTAMAPKPDDRYPSAAELALDLQRYQAGQLVRAHAYSPVERITRWVRRRPAAVDYAVLSAAVAGLALFAVIQGTSLEPTCELSNARLAEVWRADIAREIEQAFANRDNPNGATVGRQLSKVINERVVQWQQGRKQACEATARGAQSSAILDARMHCFNTQLTALKTYTTAWRSELNRQPIDRALGHAVRLLNTDRCTAAAVSNRPAKPSTESGNRVERLIAEANAFMDLNEPEQARSLASRAYEEARTVADDALLAEALYTQSDIARHDQRYDQAVELLLRCAEHAGAAQHHELLAIVASDLVYVSGDRLGRIDEATRLGRLAAALVRLNHDAPALWSRLNSTLGISLQNAGRYEESERRLRDALAARRLRIRERPRLVFDSLNALGNTLVLAGNLDEAEALFRESIALIGRVEPGSTRRSRAAQNNLAEVYAKRQQYERAIPIWQRIEDEERTENGDASFELIFPYLNLSQAFTETSRFELGLAYAEKALTLLERLEMSRHPYAGVAQVTQATIHVAEGRAQEALELLDRSEACCMAADGPSSRLTEIRELRAKARRQLEQPRDAP